MVVFGSLNPSLSFFVRTLLKPKRLTEPARMLGRFIAEPFSPIKENAESKMCSGARTNLPPKSNREKFNQSETPDLNLLNEN